MDVSRTDRQRDRQIDRLRDRSPTTTTRGTRFRGCPAVAGENLHLRTLSCSERAIGSRRDSFRLQVEVSMCRCRLHVAGAGLQVAERAGWLREACVHPRSELVAWSTHPVSRAVPPTYLLAATWPSVVCDDWAGLRERCRRCEGQTRSEMIIRGSGQRAGQWVNLDIIFFYYIEPALFR